jgi:FkbM family methyltransferase
MLPIDPVIVEVGSIRGAHGVKLCKKFDNQLTMIACPIIAHRAAVTGSDGAVEFFEFAEISSNSIYPRHRGEGRNLRRTSNIRSVSLETIMKDNDCERIDLLFLNCEGAELGILEEVLSKPELRDRLGQLCVSFHGGRIYPECDTEEMVKKMSDFFWVVKHLFVNKDLGG